MRRSLRLSAPLAEFSGSKSTATSGAVNQSLGSSSGYRFATSHIKGHDPRPSQPVSDRKDYNDHKQGWNRRRIASTLFSDSES